MSNARNGAQRPVCDWIIKHQFNVEITPLVALYSGNPDDLNPIEISYIQKYRSLIGGRLLNVTSGGEGAPGNSPSPETRAKLSVVGKGRVFTPEACASISKALSGRKLSESHVESISASKSGTLNPIYGKARTPEFKARLSEVHKLRWSDPDTKKKMSELIKKSPNLKLGPHKRWHEARGKYSASCEYCNQ